MKRLLLCAFLFPFLVRAAAAQSTVFLVRHAETAAAAGDKNPELSEAGRERAENLATMLRDAGIAAVFATEYHRTQGTAAPVARMAGVEVSVLPAMDATRSLVTKLQAQSLSGNALVVGHSNTLPEIIKALGVSAPIKILESEYDNLFVLVPCSEPRLIRLHYGK